MASSAETELPSEWLAKYETFKTLKEHGFKFIDSGIKLEHEGKQREAIAAYEQGLTSVDKALNIYLENVPHSFWDQYYESVVKMKTTRKEVLIRLTDLQNPDVMNNSDFIPTAPSEPMPPVPAPRLNGPIPVSRQNCLPSYEEAMLNSMSSDTGSPYTHLNNTLDQLRMEQATTPQGTVIYVQENVRMYFISPDGQVGSLSSPASLTITQFQAGSEADSVPQHYLQVGDWVYPLLPGVSPILHSEFGAFIIPDVHSSIEGSAVGLILPEDADSSVYEILDDILQGIVQQATKKPSVPPPRPPPPQVPPTGATESLSHRISQGIVIGAQYLSYGLVKGAEKAGEFLTTNTPKVMAKIQPEPVPTPVPPTVTKSMKVAKNVSGTAVKVTGYVVNKIGSGTMALGRMMAPHIQTQGTKLLSKMSGSSEQEAAGKMEGALEVTAGVVQGFGTVYTALENSASILATNLANNTVQIVQHKYGQPVGEVTDDALRTVGNTAVAGYSASALTVKGIAKRAAKNAGKAVVEDYYIKSDAQPLDPKSALEKEKPEDPGAGPSGMKPKDPGPSGDTK